MAIYAWPGMAVNLTAACIAPIWREQGFTDDEGGYINIHYAEPKRLKDRKAKVEELTTWLVKAIDVDGGAAVARGRWINIHTMRADDGIRELTAKFIELAGADEMSKFDRWNKKDGPAASALWPLVDEKDVH